MRKKTVKSAAQATQNWSAAMQSPATGQNYVAGIKRVTVSPMEMAASPEAEQAYLTGIQNSVNSGRRAAGLRKRSLSDWQAQSSSLGPSGLARGAQKGSPKMAAHQQAFNPIYQQASDAASQIAKVPGDMANAAARWQAAVGVLMANKGKGKS